MKIKIKATIALTFETETGVIGRVAIQVFDYLHLSDLEQKAHYKYQEIIEGATGVLAAVKRKFYRDYKKDNQIMRISSEIIDVIQKNKDFHIINTPTISFPSIEMPKYYHDVIAVEKEKKKDNSE